MKNKLEIFVMIQKKYFQFVYFQNLSIFSVVTLNKNLYAFYRPCCQEDMQIIQKTKSSKKYNRFVKKY